MRLHSRSPEGGDLTERLRATGELERGTVALEEVAAA